MPRLPHRPCRHPGCKALTRTGYCDTHQPKRAPDNRPSAHQRGYTYRWSKASKAYLAGHPWCAECARQGRTTPAVLVDHIVPHKGSPTLFWNDENWQPLCKCCHDRKTAREDGGFGNRIAPPPSGSV